MIVLYVFLRSYSRKPLSSNNEFVDNSFLHSLQSASSHRHGSDEKEKRGVSRSGYTKTKDFNGLYVYTIEPKPEPNIPGKYVYFDCPFSVVF